LLKGRESGPLVDQMPLDWQALPWLLRRTRKSPFYRQLHWLNGWNFLRISLFEFESNRLDADSVVNLPQSCLVQLRQVITIIRCGYDFERHRSARVSDRPELRRRDAQFLFIQIRENASASSGTRLRTSGLASPASSASCSKFAIDTLSEKYSPPIFIAMSRVSSG